MMSGAKSEEAQEPVVRPETGSKIDSLANLLKSSCLSRKGERLQNLVSVPVVDMRWYLNIKAGNRYNKAPLAQGQGGRGRQSRLAGTRTRLFSTSRKGSGRKLRSVCC